MQKTALSPLAARLLTGAGVGGLGGAAVGAYRADPNDRARGAFRGALGGMAAGAAAGGLYHAARGAPQGPLPAAAPQKPVTQVGQVASATPQKPATQAGYHDPRVMPNQAFEQQSKAEAARYHGPDPGTEGVFSTAQGQRASLRNQPVEVAAGVREVGRGTLGTALYNYSNPEAKLHMARVRQGLGIERHSVADADWMDAIAHGLASQGVGNPTPKDIDAVIASPQFQATLRHIKTGAWRLAKIARLQVARAYGLTL